MSQTLQLVAVVLLFCALVYVLYLYWRRRDTIECPSCGARVDLYKEECPHCGHEKQSLTADLPATDTTADDPVRETDDDDPEEDAAEAASAALKAADVTERDNGETDATVSADDAEEPGETITCEECGKEFESEHGLKIHTGMKH